MSDNTNPDGQSSDRDGQDDQNTTQNDELGEKGQAAIKAERDARRRAERDLKALQSRLAELEGKDKSDVERLTGERDAAGKRAEEALTKLRNANARTAVYDEVGSLASPRAIYALIRDDVEFDDEDQPTNVAELIAREKKADPSLFRAAAGSGDGGARSSDTKPDFKNPLERLSHAYASNTEAKRR